MMPWRWLTRLSGRDPHVQSQVEMEQAAGIDQLAYD